MCGETETRNSRHRNTPQAVVNVCERGISAATAPLEDRIAELEAELSEARVWLNELSQQNTDPPTP